MLSRRQVNFGLSSLPVFALGACVSASDTNGVPLLETYRISRFNVGVSPRYSLQRFQNDHVVRMGIQWVVKALDKGVNSQLAGIGVGGTSIEVNLDVVSAFVPRTVLVEPELKVSLYSETPTGQLFGTVNSNVSGFAVTGSANEKLKRLVDSFVVDLRALLNRTEVEVGS